MSSSQKTLWTILFIIAATFIAYQPALKGGYIWDDYALVKDNVHLQNWNGLHRLWTDPRANPMQYYPITFTSFWLDYQLWQYNPLGYHLVNVFLHCIFVLLLWRILAFLEIPGAWFIAAVFALHPIHVESVAWISERKNTLSGIFYLLAFYCYLRFYQNNSKWLYLGSCFFYLVALGAKTATCSLPVALLIVLWWKHGTLNKRDFLLTIPFFLIGIPAALITVWIEYGDIDTTGKYWSFSFVERILIGARVWWFYLYKFIFPLEQIFIYPRWHINTSSLWQWSLVVTGIFTLMLAWSVRKRIGRGPLAALLFFSATVFPVLGFFRVYFFRLSFVADHFTYLPSLGIIVLIGACGYQFFHNKPFFVRVPIAVVIFFILAKLTWNQSFAYQSGETLWKDTLAKNPKALIAYNNLGMIYIKQKRLPQAVALFQKAIAIDNSYEEAHYNLAVIYEKYNKNFNKAKEHYQKAIKGNPGYINAYFNLAILYVRQKEYNKAIENYLQVLKLAPKDYQAHNNIAHLYMVTHNNKKAMQHLKMALTLTQDEIIYTNLAKVYFALGDKKQAIFSCKKALAINPRYVPAHMLLKKLQK